MGPLAELVWELDPNVEDVDPNVEVDVDVDVNANVEEDVDPNIELVSTLAVAMELVPVPDPPTLTDPHARSSVRSAVHVVETNESTSHASVGPQLAQLENRES